MWSVHIKFSVPFSILWESLEIFLMLSVLEHKANHNYKSYIHISFQLPCCILPLFSVTGYTLPTWIFPSVALHWCHSSPDIPSYSTEVGGICEFWVQHEEIFRADVSDIVKVLLCPVDAEEPLSSTGLWWGKVTMVIRKDNLTSMHKTFWFSQDGLSLNIDYLSLLPCLLMITSTKIVIRMAFY